MKTIKSQTIRSKSTAITAINKTGDYKNTQETKIHDCYCKICRCMHSLIYFKLMPKAFREYWNNTLTRYGLINSSSHDRSDLPIIRHLLCACVFPNNIQKIFLMPIVGIDTCTHSIKSYQNRVLICFLLVKQYIFHRCVPIAS